MAIFTDESNNDWWKLVIPLQISLSLVWRDKGYLRVSESLLEYHDFWQFYSVVGQCLLHFCFTVDYYCSCSLFVNCVSHHFIWLVARRFVWHGYQVYYGIVIMHAICLFTNRKKNRRIPLSTLSDLCAVWVIQLGKNMIETKCTELSSWLIALSTLTLEQGSSLRVLAVGFSTRHSIALNR